MNKLQLRYTSFMLLLTLLLSISLTVSAQEAPLNAEEVSVLVPVGFTGGEGYAAVSEDGQYAVARLNFDRNFGVYDGTLIDLRNGSSLQELGRTSYTAFVDNKTLLWISAIESQSPRVYALPEMTELGRFPLGIRPTPRKYGPGYFYGSGQARFYQPADMSASPVQIAGGLGYTEGYRGDLHELPDGHTVVIAGKNGLILYDLETSSEVKKISYPLGQAITSNVDGTRLSAVTNHDVFSSQASTWLVYDLLEDKALIELFGTRGAHGVISPSGQYAAGTQMTTDSAMGVLRVYETSAGTELTKVDGVAHGHVGFGTHYLFAGEKLIYLREWDGDKGLLTIYNPESNTHSATDWEVYYAPQPLPGGLLMLYLSRFDVNNRFGIFDPAAERMVREFPYLPELTEDGRQIIVRNVVYGLPTAEHPALPALTGTTNGSNINVRATPSTNGQRINGATGEVTAIARNPDSSWIYLASHGGWVAIELVNLSGDINSLTQR